MIMINRPSLRRSAWAIAATGSILAVVFASAPAQAHPSEPRFTEVDLVSNQPGKAALQDPLLVNAWGLALGPTSPLWVANNGTNTASIYRGGGATPIANAGFAPVIPGGAPTGQVFNDTDQFKVTGPTGTTATSNFIFDSEGGDVTAWSGAVDRLNAFVVAHVDGAVFKGLALWHTDLGPFLLAADFHNGTVDVFDGRFTRLVLPARYFHDPALPAGYAPFNVVTSGDHVFVSYAKQGDGVDQQEGAGLGFVDEYTDFGQVVHRVATRGTLNAPWGMAIAPASFGKLAGDLLVGNLGDGHIGAYHDRHFDGLLTDAHGKPIAIDGLWALLPGTATSGGVDSVWFSAGPDEEANGLVGLLTPATG